MCGVQNFLFVKITIAITEWKLFQGESYSIFPPMNMYILLYNWPLPVKSVKEAEMRLETKHWFEHVASGISCMMVMEEVQTGMERIGQQDSWTKWKRVSDRKSTWSEFQSVDIQDMKWPGWYQYRVLRMITEAKTQKRAPTIQEPSMSSDQWRSHR